MTRFIELGNWLSWHVWREERMVFGTVCYGDPQWSSYSHMMLLDSYEERAYG